MFLRSACGGDAQLEAELRSLLAAHDRAGGFLGDPAMDLAARQQQELTRQLEAAMAPYQSYVDWLEKAGRGDR